MGELLPSLVVLSPYAIIPLLSFLYARERWRRARLENLLHCAQITTRMRWAEEHTRARELERIWMRKADADG